jgi:glutamine synthetase
MSLPDLKKLKKLADYCRKAGIKSFKNPEFEFTLTDERPISTPKTKSRLINITQNGLDNIASDTLTQEQLLMWSTSELPDIGAEQ